MSAFPLSKHAKRIMTIPLQWRCLCSKPENKCTLSVLCYFKDNGNAFSDYSTTETSMLQHVRFRAHRATQSMCFCHQADCMPREPVILGVRFYFEQTVFGPQAPAMVRKMKQVSALLKQQRFCESHMCVKKTKYPNNSQSWVYNNDPPLFPPTCSKVSLILASNIMTTHGKQHCLNTKLHI